MKADTPGMEREALPDASPRGHLTLLPRGPSTLNRASATAISIDSDQGSVAPAEKDYDSEDLAYRSNDEEAGRLVQTQPRKPRKISQKKKIEQANFGTWLDRNRKNLTQRSGKPATEHEQSVQYLVKTWEGESIINNPRDYQLELFERAKEKNTIAVLDTGKYSIHPQSVAEVLIK